MATADNREFEVDHPTSPLADFTNTENVKCPAFKKVCICHLDTL